MCKTFTKVLPVPENYLVRQDNAEYLSRITDRSFLFSLFDSYAKGMYIPITIADGIIVPIKNYNEMIKMIDAYLSSIGKIYTITGNAGSGHISVVALFDPRLPNYEEDLSEYSKTIFAYVKKYKGGISAMNGEGLSRTPYMSFVYNDTTLEVFKKIKDAWDSESIFNPCKKISTPPHFLHKNLIRPH
jgi:FAD/FMN-containing dehydrogenase